MKKQVLGILFGLVFVIFTLGIVVASPPNPMAFYGDVEYAGTIPDGYYITAKINNAVHGQCLIINNKYGYEQNSCVVVSDQENLPINFYIGDTLIGSAIFHNLEIRNLNFTLTILPPKPAPLSNGICEVSLGECSFNFLDCHFSLTSICIENGRCDVEIGETCENAPTDCGACPAPTTPSSGGSSGGGGGGGGSSSKSVIKLTNSTNTTETTNTSSALEGMDINSLNEQDNAETKKGWFTGSVINGITNFTKSKLGIGLIIFIALLILFVILTSDKKLREENKKNKDIKVVKQSEKVKEEKSKTEKPKVEKKTDSSKAKTEMKKENTEKPKEENKK
jgi:hypothetical protein